MKPAPKGAVGADDTRRLVIRLRRIEGQVRGISRMVEEQQYCIDVLTQVAAASRALEGVALILLDDHIRHCLTEALGARAQVEDAKIAEVSNAIARLVRS